MQRQRHQALWVLFVSAQLSLGQAPAPTRTVTGTVTNAITGEPLRRALVQMLVPPQLSAFTGGDGRFQLEDAPAGTFQISVRKPGYPDTSSIADSGDLHIALVPYSKINGRVADSGGEPIEHVQVRVLNLHIVQGRKQWVFAGSAETDEDGSYSVGSLPAGRYVVRASADLSSLSQLDTLPEPGQQQLAYSPRYYPSAPDLSSAQVLPLGSGQDARLDFSLALERAFRVSGVVAGIPAHASNAFVVTDSDGEFVVFPNNGVDPATGKFELRQVPAGSWTMTFSTGDGRGNAYYASQEFRVNGADIKGLQVLAQTAPGVPVTITHATGSAPAPTGQPGGPGVQVSLASVLGSASYFAQPANLQGPQPDGEQALVLSNVRPGSYRLVAETYGAECLASAWSGSVDLTLGQLAVAPGSQPQRIDIHLRGDCAKLTVSAQPGARDANVFLVLISDATSTPPKVVHISAGRPLTLDGLSPGSYWLYAFTNIDYLEYASPEALRGFQGCQIDLQAGQQASVTVPVNQRAEN